MVYKIIKYSDFWEAVPRFNETELPKQTIKNIGKMHIVSKYWDEMNNEVFS